MKETTRLVPTGGIELTADIVMPPRAAGLVIFAHGSGSSRLSPRNRHVAHVLNEADFGTILIDLLTGDEELLDTVTAELRFDIPLLGQRLAGITAWARRQTGLQTLPLGYFGASTGAAAALLAAAQMPEAVRAVVSRGGRPDLAGVFLRRVEAATLFIVGGEDREVIDLNYAAVAQLPPRTERRIEIIPGATHLFEEPGALDRVAALASDWFHEHLAPRREYR